MRQELRNESAVPTLGWGALAVFVLLVLGLSSTSVLSAWSYAHTAQDVNHAGQLRYRSFFARELCVQAEFGHAKAVLRTMAESRLQLHQAYPASHYFDEDAFDTYAAYVEREQVPPYEVTWRHVESADRLTSELADSSRGYLKATVASFLSLLGALAAAGVLLFRSNRKLRAAEASLQQLASTDGLTGLWNRRRLYQVLETLHGELGGSSRAYAVLLADIDNFKGINDEYGHPRGDEVLARFAEVLKSLGEGEFFRYGGEEFAWVLPQADVNTAVVFAERLRARLAATPLAGIRVTASFGVASVHVGDSVSSVLERADRALYAAKKRGRDCVAIENTAAKSIPGSMPPPPN
jgi:diguanylate cyclase (GGDEF)-like protein